MLYSYICSCKILGAEGRRGGAEGRQAEDKGRGTRVEEHKHPTSYGKPIFYSNLLDVVCRLRKSGD